MINTKLLKLSISNHLPSFIKYPIYVIFKVFKFLSTGELRHLKLIGFYKKTIRKVIVDDIAFDIVIDPSNGSVDQEIYVSNAYELEALRLIRKYIKKDSICIDIGMNIGQHAIFMAKCAGEGAVYGYEPLVNIYKQANESILINKLNNIFINNYGISNQEQSATIHTNNLNMGSSSLTDRKGFGETQVISLKTLDTVWDKNRRIDFIKMDIEGHEYQAFLGMEKCLSTFHPIIFFEFSPVLYKLSNFSGIEILDYLDNLGYKIFDTRLGQKEIEKESFGDFLSNTKKQANLLCIPK